MLHRVALCLILGALTTFLVSAACGLFLRVPYGFPQYRPQRLTRTFIIADRPWVVHEIRRTGLTTCWWNELTRDYFTSPPPSDSGEIPPPSVPPQEDPAAVIRDFLARQSEHSNPNLPRPRVLDSPAHWGEFSSGRAPTRRTLPTLLPSSDPFARWPTNLTGADFGYGWPCIAFWYQTRGRIQGNASDIDSFAGALVIQGNPDVRGQPNCRVIPFWPVWRGLLIDIALYAVLWSLLLFGLPALRRAVRRRKGLCPHCAYDLRATPPNQPCPECGQMP